MLASSDLPTRPGVRSHEQLRLFLPPPCSVHNAYRIFLLSLAINIIIINIYAAELEIYKCVM